MRLMAYDLSNIQFQSFNKIFFNIGNLIGSLGFLPARARSTYYEKTTRHAAEDLDINLLTDLKRVADIEVNAFQRTSDVILQKSTREGFSFSVAKASRKEVIVAGENVGGIPMKVLDGVNGFLVNSVSEAAEKTLYLLKHPAEAKKIGAKGKDHAIKP